MVSGLRGPIGRDASGPAGRPGAAHLWLWPALAAGLSLLTLAVLLHNAHEHDREEHEKDFQSDLDSAVRAFDFRIQGTIEYLRLLTTEASRGALQPDDFRAEVPAHVRETPELFRVAWLGPDATILAVAEDPSAPTVPPPTRGLGEPTEAFVRLDRTEGGLAVVEVRVPVLRDGEDAGRMGALLSCEALLRQAVPQHVSDTNDVGLLDANGALVCSLDQGQKLDRNLVADAPLSGLAGAMTLRLHRHATGLFEPQMWLLIALCTALTLAMAFGMFQLARNVEARRRAQEILRHERDNLVNVLEAMEDGVAVVSAGLEVQYVNRVLERDFGPYAGRKCYEYFHGHEAPCSWCMMEDVVAGKTVHTEWCYPRNERTYDLLDTRITNADGSVSKLKMFRDITERVQAEADLRESEERFHDLFERAADPMFLHDARGRIVEVNQAACDGLGYRRSEFRDLRLCDIHDEAGALSLAELLDGLAPRAPVTLSTRHRRKDGTTFPVEVRISRFDYRRERLLLSTARDITERERAERAGRKQLEAERAAAEQTRARLAQSESLHRISAALLGKVTLDEVLDVVCAEARRLTGATGSGVLLLDDEHFNLTNWIGSPEPGTDRISAAGSFAGRAVARGEPLFVPDVAMHPLACYHEPRPGALILVPLRAAGKIIGVLDVCGESQSFVSSDTRILSHFADQAALAIERARLQEKAEQGAVLEERHRLARELHDSVTQSLYSASLYADAAGMVSGAGRAEVVASHVGVVKNLIREALLQMRVLIYELRPPALDRGGLVGAIEARLAAVEERAGLQTEVCCGGDVGALPPGVEEALYGFTVEALNNALKHAKARHVSVHVHFEDSCVGVEVLDDGVGFDEAAAAQAGGLGLQGMRERLERLGGHLVIESAPQRGTRLTAEVSR